MTARILSYRKIKRQRTESHRNRDHTIKTKKCSLEQFEKLHQVVLFRLHWSPMMCWENILPGLTPFLTVLQIHPISEHITESQNHRMVGVGRDLCGLSSPTLPVEAGSLRAGCTGPPPGGFWISPEKEKSQPLWATCSSAPSPSEWRSSSSGSAGTSYASLWPPCPLSSCWAPPKRVWTHPLDTHPEDTYRHF